MSEKIYRPVVLVIIDGWGIGRNDQSNPLFTAPPAVLNSIKDSYLSGSLQASGIAVGLPWGEESNSEVGHLTIGAGKVIYQHFLRISNSIRDGSFFSNPAFLSATHHIRKTGGVINFVGLLTDGIVHASLDHLKALTVFAKKNNAPYRLHLFADGKDSAPKSVLSLINKLGEKPQSLSGRYFALDRDSHFDRTERAYKALTNQTQSSLSIEEAARAAYDTGLIDEFFEPANFGPVFRGIEDGDALVFFDFREDSIRQIAEAFINKEFSSFSVQRFQNLFVVTMTNYSAAFAVPIAFPPETIEYSLARVLSDAKKRQLHIAETEKYAHVTRFFNGLREDIYPGEERVLIQSRTVAHHNEVPEMRAREITDAALSAIKNETADFILINFANCDIVAHTGDFAAAERAIAAVDTEIGSLRNAVLEHDGAMVITSDHGNVEVMRDTATWLPETKHDQSPVPIYVVGAGFESAAGGKQLHNVGLLSDVAPTILELMGVPKPAAMNGQSLLRFLE